MTWILNPGHFILGGLSFFLNYRPQPSLQPPPEPLPELPESPAPPEPSASLDEVFPPNISPVTSTSPSTADQNLSPQLGWLLEDLVVGAVGVVDWVDGLD